VFGRIACTRECICVQGTLVDLIGMRVTYTSPPWRTPAAGATATPGQHACHSLCSRPCRLHVVFVCGSSDKLVVSDVACSRD